MLVKIHKSYRTVVAICDKELVGKTFEQGDKIIDVKPGFYKGDEKSEQEVFDIIDRESAEDATFNIVGKKSVALALKTEIIKPEGIEEVQGIPIALVLL